MAKKTNSKDKITFQGLVARYKEADSIPAECVSTNIDCLDDQWGGGVHLGYCYSLWGPAGCGKSTLALQVVKAFCKKGKKVVALDVEKAMNDRQIDTFGLREFVDNGTFVILPIDTYAEWEDVMDGIIEDGTISLMLVDSETMTKVSLPQELRVTDVRPAIKAAQGSFILNKMKSMFYHHRIASIVLFHARANFSINGGTVSDTKQAGGFAAEHVPDIITKLTIHEKIKEGTGDDAPQIGVGIKIECTKNKFAAPFRPIKKKLIFGKGILKRIDLIDTALERGIITMAGAGFFTLPDGTKGRGTQALYDLPNDKLAMIQKHLKAQ